MVTKPMIKKLLADYEKMGVVYDEFWKNQQEIYDHWTPFIEKLVDLGMPEMQQRQVELQRLLMDLGVTYNVYSNPAGPSNLWKLDPIPYMVPADTWTKLERGIKQRAILLDLLLKDIYGPRKLIKDGILPMELLFVDRHFLRPCVPFPKNDHHQLLLYGADISKGPNGNLWVVGDRTQVPSGWSYTMVNRIAMARILPEFFNSTPVKKVVPFFQKIRDHLISFAPNHSEDPLIVLLTPGQFNETYFEHAFLANIQGYTLAQGNDLMVQDGFLWLKTIGGLEKVDILVRHVDDDFCDPLSLRPESQLGVAGLVEVMRKGNVTIANPLGSGVLENPGLMAFMPSLCQYYLGESLILPNIATWWCGQPQAKNYVIEHLEQLVIKRLDRKEGKRTVFGDRLTKEEKATLIAEINQSPYYFIGQEQAIFSTSPSFKDAEIQPHHTVLRGYAVAGPKGYDIMPGGLTRSAPSVGTIKVSNQSGGLGKDTWVLSEELQQDLSFQFKHHKPHYSYRGIQELSSGIASNMFWVGRYMMRAKLSVGLLRIILRYLAEIENFKDPVDRSVLSILLQSLTHATMTYPGFVGEGGDKKLEAPASELWQLVTDENMVGSLAHTILMWKGAANTIRNLWSADTWRIFDKVDQIRLGLKGLNEVVNIRALRQKLDILIDAIVASFGFTRQTLSIEEGGPLFEIGVDLEDMLLRSSLFRSTLAVKQDGKVEDELLEALLLATGSLNTYRHRYRGQFQLAAVIELTLVDHTYPGSIAAALERLAENLDILPQQPSLGGLRLDQKEVLRLSTALKLSTPNDLATSKSDQLLLDSLDELLTDLRGGLLNCSNSVVNTFFSHATYKPQQAPFLFDLDF